ncbi:hypothetical protein BSL78_11433 [Apostichopus japonicus]|uniref:Ig-like domain-containing protein n=1 Tax=Stichopus japonicus TaxID=307972 RepID=A0A2G8KUK4_STIJA|nr:hypothetical protein BSL78_11433 [Apostichopus japonicus]
MSTTSSDLGGIAAGTCYFEVKKSDFIITWQLEGAPVLRHDSNDYSSKVVGRHNSTIGENGRVAELSIADITFEDSGTYTCAKSYLVEGLPEEYKWILHVQVEADVDLMHQKTMEVSQNHKVILVCQASGFPIPNVNLQRINTLYEWESLSNQPHINESESLWWYELKEYSDRDAYRCLANNTVDEFATSEVVVLSVIGGINPLPTDSTQLLLIMLISSVAVVFFICILIILVCKKYLLSLGDDTGFTRNTDTVTVDSGKKKTENLDTVELYCTIPNDTGTVNNDTMLLIPEKNLTFGKQLKRSALRQRWKGNFRKESSVIDVHVSSCGCDQQETDEWTSFIRCIRQLPSHTNIVKLLGQCVELCNPYVNIPSEVLAQKEYTQMSDIWAVGVLIWELFSYGAHLPTHKEVAQNERHAMELCKPEKCPKNIYDAILDSWKHDPRSRPTLMELEHEMTQASASYALNTDNKKNTVDVLKEVAERQKESNIKTNVYDRNIVDQIT